MSGHERSQTASLSDPHGRDHGSWWRDNWAFLVAVTVIAGTMVLALLVQGGPSRGAAPAWAGGRLAPPLSERAPIRLRQP
jgi:hypothetical protein